MIGFFAAAFMVSMTLIASVFYAEQPTEFAVGFAFASYIVGAALGAIIKIGMRA